MVFRHHGTDRSTPASETAQIAGRRSTFPQRHEQKNTAGAPIPRDPVGSAAGRGEPGAAPRREIRSIGLMASAGERAMRGGSHLGAGGSIGAGRRRGHEMVTGTGGTGQRRWRSGRATGAEVVVEGVRVSGRVGVVGWGVCIATRRATGGIVGRGRPHSSPRLALAAPRPGWRLFLFFRGVERGGTSGLPRRAI